MNHAHIRSKLIPVVTIVFILAASSFAALPELKVNTLNNAAVNSQQANRQGAGNCQSANTYSHKYVAMRLTLTDAANPANNITVSTYKDSIRGRGNSTWAADKKPYRIKFDDNKSMFGSKKHRSWALLANWYDPTFTLNAVGFELGRRLGLHGTPGYYFVDFYLNDVYKGIYQITDLVQVNKGRVDIDTAQGWLVEFDYHCPSDADEIDFNTDYPNNPSSARLHSYIKSPEDLRNQSGYDFVKNDVKNLTKTMFATTGFPTNGYRDLVDLESVVKYFMIEQFMDNFDFNNKADNSRMPASNYFHKDKGGRIMGGPIWDLDLAAGVEMGNFPKHYQTYQTAMRPAHPFHSKFFDDPAFMAKWKKNWDAHKNTFRAMTGVMDSIANIVQGSVEKNFRLQNGGNSGGGGTCDWVTNPMACMGGGGFPGMGGGFGSMTPDAPATLQAYKDEVGKLKTWWNNRMNFFEQEINKLNIDVSKDVIQTPMPAPGNSTSVTGGLRKNLSGLSVVRNGLKINANDKASMKVFTLTGSAVRKQTLAAGNHTVSLADLPRGMYLVRVNLDGVKQTVKMAVR